MPRFNFYVILFALLVYALTAEVTLRDRLLIFTLYRIEHYSYVEPSAKDLFEGAMSGMVKVLSDDLGDQYSRYIPPSKQTHYLDNAHNRYEGFGFSFQIDEEGEEKKLVITHPFPNSPAYQAGIRSGDQILQVEGTPLTDKTREDVLQLLKPQQESEIRLSILPFGQTEPQNVVVRPQKIHFDSVTGDYVDSEKHVFCLETHPLIGYIWITSFTETTAKEFGDALEQMMQSGVESFILDLRDNPGGDVWNSVQTAKMLIAPEANRKTIAEVRYRHGHRGSFNLAEGTQRCTLPMVVLINGESASSAEILAAALQDYRRAAIVGTRSFGKGVIQGIMVLPFQSGILQLTDAEYRRPSGANIHRKKDAADSDEWGVTPDKIVELSDTESLAVMEYRSLRSQVLAAQRSAVLEQFRQRIIDNHENERHESEEQTLEQKKWGFTGTAPYYDAQLDEAVKILTMGV